MPRPVAYPYPAFLELLHLPFYHHIYFLFCRIPIISQLFVTIFELNLPLTRRFHAFHDPYLSRHDRCLQFMPPGSTDYSSSYTLPPPPPHTPLKIHSQPLPTFPYHHPFFSIRNETQLLTPQSKYHLTRAIKSGWVELTVKRYSNSIDEYICFCDTEGVPNHLRFPADEFVLCAFAASSAGIHSWSTPHNQLSALKAWHIAHNVKWNGSPRLCYVLSGVHNLAP